MAGEHNRLVLVVLAVGVGLAAVVLEPRAVVRSAASLAGGESFLLIVAVGYLVRPLLAVPMSLLTVVVGWRYGVVAGLPIAVLGTAVTTYPPYYAGRYSRSDAGVLGWLSRRGERAFDATGDLRGMVASRLAPAPADGVSYGAGVAGVGPATYVAGTVLGELPWTVGYLLVGHSMGALALREVRIDARLLVVAAVVAMLVVAPPAWRVLRTAREE